MFHLNAIHCHFTRLGCQRKLRSTKTENLEPLCRRGTEIVSGEEKCGESGQDGRGGQETGQVCGTHSSGDMGVATALQEE